MKCEFCNGEGQIWILSYCIKDGKEITLREGKLFSSDCPKCNGSGNKIEGVD